MRIAKHGPRPGGRHPEQGIFRIMATIRRSSVQPADPKSPQAIRAPQALVALALFVALTAGLGAGAAGAQSAEGDDRAAAIRILELVNRDRGRAALPALAERADVLAVAASWSTTMAQARALSHNDDYFSAASIERLNAKSLGENVARNGDVDDAHARLMASPGHHANIMSAKFTVVGIAVFRDADGTYWVTESFLLPNGASPAAPSVPASPRAGTPAVESATQVPKTTLGARPAPRPVPLPAPPVSVPPPELAVARTAAETASFSSDAPQVSNVPAAWSPDPAFANAPPDVGFHPALLAAGGGNALAALGLVAARRRHPAARRSGRR